MEESERIERLLDTTYRDRFWKKFIHGIHEYSMISPGDRICVCISGGKDSMLMALLFKHLHRYTDIDFDVEYLVMNPGYRPDVLELIQSNLKRLDIPAKIVSANIFAAVENVPAHPCSLCAKMRRGTLYRIARDELGCNKIALGHHYDDVITTTLMNLLNSGSYQTMLPKLKAKNYKPMELIRPLYFIREKDIISFARAIDMHFIACACPLADSSTDLALTSMRAKTKALIARLMKDYSPYVERSLFAAGGNVKMDAILGYRKGGVKHSYLEDYDKEKSPSDEGDASCEVEQATGIEPA